MPKLPISAVLAGCHPIPRMSAMAGAVVLLLCVLSHAQAPYRVASSYEDTVRIAVLYNTPGGNCSTLPPVGKQTLDFVVKALDTTRVHHVKILVNASPYPTLTQVQNLFGTGLRPHVIVHINAGWGAGGESGPNIDAIMNWAVANYIGVVSIGDDASWLSTAVFGFQAVDNAPQPMGDATWLNQPRDSLWIKVHPGRDKFLDSLKYPYLNGIVNNASRKILRDSTLHFKPVTSSTAADGRCQADADLYTVLTGYQNRVTFLGYQQGSNATNSSGEPTGQGLVGTTDQWNVVAAFQDSAMYATGLTLRRGVALSFQPQFLQNSSAAQQVVYDAIMFASLAHTLRPVAVHVQVGSDTVEAGSYTSLQALILPDNLDPAVRARLAGTVSWRQDPRFTKPGDVLTAASGATVQVTGTQAFRSVHVIATLYDSAFRATVYDTATIYIKPGPDYRIVIERSSTSPLTQQNVWPATYNDSVTARPISGISIDSSETVAYAYAVVRDLYGNIKRVAGSATWESLASTVITAQATSGKQFEGRVGRQPFASGGGNIRALEAGTSLIADTVAVTLEAGVPIAIRLVSAGNPTVALDAIRLTTDDEVSLLVQVIMSDNPGVWVSAPSTWTMAPDTLRSANALPQGENQSWTFSPINAGTAGLTVTRGPKSVTVPVVVTPAPPTRIEFRLVDAAPSAGTRFQTEVRLYNQDGLVSGQYCYRVSGTNGLVKYFDIAGKGGTTFDPKVHTIQPGSFAGLDSGVLGIYPTPIDSVEECFDGGIDTVDVVLYNAGSTVIHQLWVHLTGKNGVQLEASTQTFGLLPGSIDRLVLERSDNTPVPDQVSLIAPDSGLYIRAVGYDRFGNRIGPIDATTWTTSPGASLHAISPGPVNFQYYTTGSVTTYENGCIMATADGKSDTVCISVRPPAAQYASVITRDISGDGRLDRLEIHLTKLVSVYQLADSLPLSDVTVTFSPTRTTSYTLPVTEIIARTPGATMDSVFYIELNETNTSLPQHSQPQTAWTPTITIDGMSDITDQPSQALDGAGPVIWKVTKVVNDISNHRTDEVTVVFSENLQDPPAAGDVPGNVFQVWRKTQIDGRDTFVLVDSVLQGIQTFGNIKGQNTVTFTMTNGKNLTVSDYLKIQTGGTLPVVTDDPSRPEDPNNNNAPIVNNQRVRVEVEGVKWTVKAGPNPFPVVSPLQRPTVNEINLTYHTKTDIIGETYDRPGWALRLGGSAIQVDVLLPSDTSLEVKNSFKIAVKLAIYDNIGNLVYNKASDDNLLNDNSVAEADFSTGWGSGKVKQLYFYWDGYNDKNMAAKPGAYRGLVALTISYTQDGNPKSSTRQSFVNFGVRR